MRSNCILAGLLLYWRLKRKGHRVYLSWRWSDHGPFPHCLVSIKRPSGFRMVSYKPIAPVKRRLPPPLFFGRYCWGD